VAPSPLAASCSIRWRSMVAGRPR